MAFSLAELRGSFFDELTKLASEEKKPSGVGRAVRAVGTAAAGSAIGYGVAEALARNTKFFTQPNQNRAALARVILPILSGAAVTLADRYRSSMDREYGSVKGYKKSNVQR